jgi:hypothetical protein
MHTPASQCKKNILPNSIERYCYDFDIFSVSHLKKQAIFWLFPVFGRH